MLLASSVQVENAVNSAVLPDRDLSRRAARSNPYSPGSLGLGHIRHVDTGFGLDPAAQRAGTCLNTRRAPIPGRSGNREGFTDEVKAELFGSAPNHVAGSGELVRGGGKWPTS